MKAKVLLLVASVLLVGYVTLVYMASPQPKFTVINRSDKPVEVVAYWRNESKNLGTLNPNQKVEFVVKDEATMSFKAKLLSGKELTSDAIYFTAGFAYEANIQGSRIELSFTPAS